MRKLIIFLTVFTSFNCFAGNLSDLGSSIRNSLQTQAANDSQNLKFPIIYGGQDFSRSVVADADESFLAGNRVLVG